MKPGQQDNAPPAAPPAEGAIRGGAAISASRAARLVLRLGITIVLARILSPDEFGLVAIVTAVFAVALVFQDFGLSTATAQRAELAPGHVDTLFWINLAVGTLLMILFLLAAPGIAQVFDRPEIENLCRVASLTFILNGLTIQNRALLQRRMQFALTAKIDILASVLCGVAALALALNGGTYWSLIAQLLVYDAVCLVGFWRASGFRPGRPCWDANLGEMVRFGASIFGFHALKEFSQHLGPALLGGLFSAAAAGSYRRGFVLATLPQALLFNSATHIAIPNLSRIRSDEDRFATFFRQSLQLVALVTVPIAAVFGALGHDLAWLVYGPKWTAVGDVLIALSPGLAATPLLNGTVTLMTALGQSGLMIRWGVLSSIAVCLGTIVGIRWGMVGIAAGWSLANLLLLVPGLWYMRLLAALDLRKILRSVAGIYGAGILMLLAGGLGRRFLEDQNMSPGPSLLLCLLASALVYLLATYFLFGQKTLVDTVLSRLFSRNK